MRGIIDGVFDAPVSEAVFGGMNVYAIANGPASLDVPLPPLGLATFDIPAFLLGIALLLGLEGLRRATARKGQPAQIARKGESLS